jgi:hypothetical protein
MKQPDIQVIESALLVRNIPGMSPFLNWLRECREDARDKCESGGADDVTHRAQGRSQAFKEILNLIDDAPGRIEKLRALK